MKHFSEDELVLYHYGEVEDGASTAAHLAQCDRCRTQYESLSRLLAAVSTTPVPARDEQYGAEVWRRVQPRLRKQAREPWIVRLKHAVSSPFAGGGLLQPRVLAMAGALAAIVVVAFLAGRFSPREGTQVAQQQQIRERILLVAVGDHLERSQMMLVELVNTADAATVDISNEQQGAADLVSANRLYRQAAVRAGDTAMASVLDDLERVLIDIANGPTEITDAQLDEIRQRIESQGILFKVEVTGSQVRARQRAESERLARTSS